MAQIKGQVLALVTMRDREVPVLMAAILFKYNFMTQ
ncbi:hypothetical protein E308F_05410 [Moorella sp. E308F]|nr:hypothetical protein E308F_05410 [Moorella sp. E308F]GEA18333.1 hypothetical protein E306M_14690 [Moorella sp. E306M]